MGRARGATQPVSFTARFADATAPGAGAQTNSQPPGPPKRISDSEVIDRLGFGRLLAPRTDRAVRDLNRETFVIDTEAWKEQENAFVEAVRSDLEAGMVHFAQSDENWRAFQRMCAQGGLDHSPLNELWKRWQLRHKWERLIAN